MSGRIHAMARPIFDDPPDDMELNPGFLLLNWNGEAGIATSEVATAFHVAAERLLDAALADNESWEAAYPILFCYRHGLEVFLKDILSDTPAQHGLIKLWELLLPHLTRLYPPGDVAWLGARIAEFEHVDPRSTAFRYANAVPADRRAELWVDLHHLKQTTAAMFQALERIWLDLMSDRTHPTQMP